MIEPTRQSSNCCHDPHEKRPWKYSKHNAHKGTMQVSKLMHLLPLIDTLFLLALVALVSLVDFLCDLRLLAMDVFVLCLHLAFIGVCLGFFCVCHFNVSVVWFFIFATFLFLQFTIFFKRIPRLHKQNFTNVICAFWEKTDRHPKHGNVCGMFHKVAYWPLLREIYLQKLPGRNLAKRNADMF